MMPRILNVLGIDPSLRNWGLAFGTLQLDSLDLNIYRLEVINPVIPTGKQVRQNSKDLESAFQLAAASQSAAQGQHAIFVEVPVGSQSARAMASYGICVGVLGALRATGIPFFEVTPTEVKMALTGDKNASKDRMITAAMKLHPNAPWPLYKTKCSEAISSAKAEHMADAIGAIYAGIHTNAFMQLQTMLK